MKNLKQEIINILISEQEICKIGSDGEYSTELCVFADDFELVSDKIIALIQIVFDPENQPNQLGIGNPFEFKYCMPDGIETEEDHREYLKAIGYKKFTKCLDCNFIACENHNKCIKDKISSKKN